MRFCIADSFPKALAKLPAQEQKAVKTTVFDLQMDPTHPSLQFHRIDKSKDLNFWSVRVSRDIRLIIHKTEGSFLICYVDHHDAAYEWAERRRIEVHPTTGAAQIVEVRERVQEILVHRPVDTGPVAVAPEWPLLFARYSDDELLTYGVPQDWLDDVRGATEDTIFDLVAHLPGEAAEALLDLAVGETPERPAIVSPEIANPFEHPDAQRRFRIMEDSDELRRALEYPWDQWAVFLHPSQRQVVGQKFSGPARVSGSAGTGKTVVAIHRAANVLKGDPQARLLLTTFSLPLANALEGKLRLLVGSEKGIVPRVTVLPFRGVANELFTLAFGHHARAASEEQIRGALKSAAAELGVTAFTLRFLASEWLNVVDAWQVADSAAYQEVPRLGRKNRLGVKQRETLWPVFERARAMLAAQGVLTWPMIFGEVTRHFSTVAEKPFSHAIVDEAQDLGVPELRMLAAITPPGADRLFFAGDLGQRIFQEPFSWKTLGVDIRGRSKTLKVNYRTSHQIRQAADRLLPKVVQDVDGIEQDRRGTVSVFNGPEPEVRTFPDIDAETQGVADWIKGLVADGVAPAEIGLFVRSNAELGRARAAVKAAGHTQLELSERLEDPRGRVAIGTMHLAKGLEYKAIAVMACDDDILPLQDRVETVADESELDEVYETERHLFYVACTRARDQLLVAGVTPASEFISDLGRTVSNQGHSATKAGGS
ncbi:3'-5' exonuclease [Sinorhizobium meliloti]|uniref:3'-5' exonuclease n=1 Tax=Rhizobium meliloti TaxID=382 RepID=UPI0002D2EE7F|nr:3'-5' exonuclease [Sinorhizobium meliloti]MDE3767562.1 UvrD-helicase domain-containing protein [Sinorhizobium meliloti]MDE3779808.1 UvrD-helicase domain-containing protein [Sinorhizobium meliloti]MDE3807433.1 UvrD-helicase domain-containing protein [Sinorhizobium meliloti]